MMRHYRVYSLHKAEIMECDRLNRAYVEFAKTQDLYNILTLEDDREVEKWIEDRTLLRNDCRVLWVSDNVCYLYYSSDIESLIWRIYFYERM